MSIYHAKSPFPLGFTITKKKKKKKKTFFLAQGKFLHSEFNVIKFGFDSVLQDKSY